MNLTFTKTALPEVIHIQPTAFEDDRGWLVESYNKNIFSENGINEIFLQEKHSFSKKNVLRGLHFQKDPWGQGKLVRCSLGRIFDVAVDIRPNSPNYGKWVGVELSHEKKNLLYIPAGFAHGFVVLSDEGAYFSYLISFANFNKEYDAGIYYDDPAIGINWPVNKNEIILSEKDKKLPFLQNL
jgi:dTDP-4-dehydrorhamnose 3,5-epimerase